MEGLLLGLLEGLLLAAAANDMRHKYNVTSMSQPTVLPHPLLAIHLPHSPVNQDLNGRNAG
jgi:hypothetical protein